MASDPAARADLDLVVVLGGTGGLGGALVRELAGRGLRVRAVARSPSSALPEGVELRAADAKSGSAPRMSTVHGWCSWTTSTPTARTRVL